MERIRRFFEAAFLSFKASYGYLSPENYILVKLINPVFQMIFFCMIAQHYYESANLALFIVGNSLILCDSNCIFGLGNTFLTDRYTGTLKNIIASPGNKMVIFIQRAVNHVLDSLTTVVLSLIAGSLIFQVNLLQMNLLLFAVTLLIAMFAACCFGLFVGSMGLVTNEIHILLNVMSMSFLALTGANFPVESLPVLLRGLSRCLPLTRSIQASEILLSGGGFQEVGTLLAGEMGIGIVYIGVGYCSIRLFERIAVKKGSLDIF